MTPPNAPESTDTPSTTTTHSTIDTSSTAARTDVTDTIDTAARADATDRTDVTDQPDATDRSDPADAEPHAAPETVAAAVEDFVTQVTDALAAAEAPAETVQAVADSGATLTTQVTAAVETAATTQAGDDTQSDRVAALEDRVDELERELQAERETRAKEAAEDRQRLHDLETRVEDGSRETTDESTPTDDSPAGPTTVPAKTPLEEVIRVPDHLAADQLTANQRRARFVAKDIHEYSRRVPAGRAIKSSELRRVLAASEEATIHSETVSRVVRFLDDLGGDAVRVRESSSGQRVVVFDDAFVDRVRQYQHAIANHTVVTPTGAEG